MAGWLPGSEGAGFADVLLARADGTPRNDFQGRLSFSWPKRPDQSPLNVDDANYDPQFAFGFGLSYASPRQTPKLAEVASTTRYGERNVYYASGTAWNGYRLWIGDSNAPRMDYVGTRTTLYGSAALSLEPEGTDALRLSWYGKGKGKAMFAVGADTPTDIAREANGAMMIALKLKVNAKPTAAVRLGVGSASVIITDRIRAIPVGSYATLSVPLSCFAAQDFSATPTVAGLETDGSADLSLQDIRLLKTKTGAAYPPQ